MSLSQCKQAAVVEVCLKSESSASYSETEEAVRRLLKEFGDQLPSDGCLPLPSGIHGVDANVESITISKTGESLSAGKKDSQEDTQLILYQLNEDEPGEEMEDEDEISTYREWSLPSRSFHKLWESLVFEVEVKKRLLNYASSALLFSDLGVDNKLVAWNRLALLHGPPGTGKTSLCKALAQKLAIGLNGRYSSSQLVEVNAHSLFSKWFSESGKLVTKLFSKIQELVEDEDSLIFVLIDEVESLTAARKGALSGAEPSDAIRVVNALLTQLDALNARPNVMFLCTTNLTEAIDIAFVDRADLKVPSTPDFWASSLP
ncbi:hypothetical protein CYMTET_23618, partial [Cymbomonas tetramitiformis]